MGTPRTTFEDVKASFDKLREALKSAGVDTDKWKLVQLPGEGFMVLNVSAGFPEQTGNRVDTINLCNTWISVLGVVDNLYRSRMGAPVTVETEDTVPAATFSEAEKPATTARKASSK